MTATPRWSARELLGKWLVHQAGGVRRIGKIVETEAYLGEHDLAAHSAKGRTARTKSCSARPGHAYVYFIYGMYFCMNVVTEPRRPRLGGVAARTRTGGQSGRPHLRTGPALPGDAD